MSIEVKILRLSNGLMINYSYLVINTLTHTSLLIDPAWEQNKIEQALEKSGSQLVAILLTHHHKDHVHLADPIATKFNVPVYMSQIEMDYYQFNCKNLIGIKNFTPINLGNIFIHPILTPGHTKGGTAFLIENNLFTGDTLFIEGCGLCSGNGGDPEAMFNTLQKLKALLKPDTLIFPGHSYGKAPGKPFAYVLENNIYLHFNNKQEFIQFRMRPNQKNLFSFK